MDYTKILKAEEYRFIRENEHLGKYVILLGLSGSYSYGTDYENSDIDVRGVALNRKPDLIGRSRFEQYVDDVTDTTIYGFQKMITLLLSCNPNTIELLGLNQEHYLYLNDIGGQLVGNSRLFLSKRAIQSFGGYADRQLRRLQNALARDSFPLREKEEHIFRSLQHAMYEFKSRYEKFEEGSIRLSIGESRRPDLETEIFADVSLHHYPLRDYKNIFMEMNHIIGDYDKIGKRNKKKDDNHLNKHAMHLIRLFMMAIDILEQEKIITCRRKEHSLLMDIRNGAYQKEDGTFREEFYQMLSEYETRLAYAAENTSLPDEPDFKRVEEFVMEVNERVVRDEI